MYKTCFFRLLLKKYKHTPSGFPVIKPLFTNLQLLEIQGMLTSMQAEMASYVEESKMSERKSAKVR